MTINAVDDGDSDEDGDDDDVLRSKNVPINCVPLYSPRKP